MPNNRKKGPPKSCCFSKMKGKAGREKEGGVSFGRCHCYWQPTDTDSPIPPIPLSVCVCVCKRDREWDIGRVWLFNLPLSPLVCVCVCVSVCLCVCVCVQTLPTPNLSALTGSQIKWSERAINAGRSGPVGCRRARCVAPASSATWAD